MIIWWCSWLFDDVDDDNRNVVDDNDNAFDDEYGDNDYVKSSVDDDGSNDNYINDNNEMLNTKTVAFLF